MTELQDSGEDVSTPGKGLRRAAWTGVASGVSGVVLFGLAILGSLRSESAYDTLMHGALALGLLGNALSLGVLGIALCARSRYPGEVIGQVSVLLPIPFVLILPVCYFEALGRGLGGETAASNFYGTVGSISFILAPVTFIVGLVAGIRSRGPSNGVK